MCTLRPSSLGSQVVCVRCSMDCECYVCTHAEQEVCERCGLPCYCEPEDGCECMTFKHVGGGIWQLLCGECAT